jgi:hypothetical protein
MISHAPHFEGLSTDEERLVIFFRALTPSQQFNVMHSVGQDAANRCLLEVRTYELMPELGGIKPKHEPLVHWDSSTEGALFEIINDAIEATGDPESYLLGSEAFDELEAIPRFVEGASRTADQSAFWHAVFDEQLAREYINEWRENIARECGRVVQGMAQTAADAEAQLITVPDSPKDWIAFALTLDGDRIAEELDWCEPGRVDTNLLATLDSLNDETGNLVTNDTPEVSPVLLLRMALYEKLRFLQEHSRLPPSGEELIEIEHVLRWLRKH